MRGHLEKRGQSWRLKYDLGVDPKTGARQTKRITLKARTKAEAQRQMAIILAGVAQGTHIDPNNQTVGDFVEHWLTTEAKPNVSAKTLEGYDQLLRKHLLPRCGLVKLQQLNAGHLKGCYAFMAESGLSGRRQLHLHRVVFRMLKHARQWGAVHQNVADLIDAPTAASEEIEILTPAQVQTVLESLKGRTLHPIVALALGSGARRGELLALRWSDLDFDKGTLRIERAVEQTTQRTAIKGTKTKHGRRTLTLPAATLDVLRAHWNETQRLYLALGRGRVSKDAYIFAPIDADSLTPRSPRSVTKEWFLLTKRLGIGVTFHALRHTCASLLIASGLDLLTISRRLGHANASITLNVYGHMMPNMDDRAAAILDAALTGRPT
jgi:integrase